MTSQPIHYENCEDALSSVQGDLLELLLQPEEDVYPWNPAELETEAYFAELERGFFLSDWQTEEEIGGEAQTFFKRLHQCWESPVSSAIDTLKESLSQQFTRVPQTWLEMIADKAQQVFSPDLSLADQLVLCVQPLFPNWIEDDLLVLARRWAFAMRGPEVDAEKNPGVGLIEWTELSQMEQVRLSLAAAHSALVELKNSAGDPEQP
ncbi:MAG: hypothetical protein LDL41_19985 [Coleofasciculus sp. S288]|nr:hypothetical protein [Coleofasciculus sp. S288]